MAQKAKTTTKAKTAAKKTAATNSTVTASRARTSLVSPQALIAESVGTFGLTLAVVLAPADQPLLVGVALAALLVGMMSISGGHFNPAVTFGLWAINKLDAVKVPFYWVAQIIGALAAFLIIGAFNGNGSKLDMSTFAVWDWPIFWVELLGTALFLFGIVATLKNVTAPALRAGGVGLALVAAIVMAGGLLTANATREQNAVQGGKAQSVSQTFAAQGVAFNPAIALAQTERDVAGINKSIKGEGAAETTQKTPSHFTLPVILGTLLGAAAGANLYLLIAGLAWKNKEL